MINLIYAFKNNISFTMLKIDSKPSSSSFEPLLFTNSIISNMISIDPREHEIK